MQSNIDLYYAKYSSNVRNLCRFITNNDPDLDDILQETWIKAYKYLNSYNEGRDFIPWIATIAKNVYKDTLKKRLEGIFVDTDELIVLPDNHADLTDILSVLNDGEFDLMYRRGVVGLSIQDLAEHYSTTEAAIKMRMARAKQKLRRALDGEVT